MARRWLATGFSNGTGTVAAIFAGIAGGFFDSKPGGAGMVDMLLMWAIPFVGACAARHGW